MMNKEVKYPLLRQFVNEMIVADQSARLRQLSPDIIWRIDVENTNRLKFYIAKFGLLSADKVGPITARGTTILAIHADHDVEFQMRYQGLLNEHDQSIDYLKAILADRIQVNLNQPQIYGTQSRKDRLWPIQDLNNIDTRRTQVGLPPIATLTKNAAIRQA